MVPKSLDAVLITLPFPGSAARVGVALVAEGDGDAFSGLELLSAEDWPLWDGVSELPHPVSTTPAVRTRATIARMPRANHVQAPQRHQHRVRRAGQRRNRGGEKCRSSAASKQALPAG